MTVIFAFYVSTGTFWWRKCLNNFSFYHFFSSRKLFGFLAISLSAGLPNMQSTWQETFSHELFSLRKLVVCIIIFRVWVEDSWIFVRFLAECQNCIPRVHRNIPRKSLFCPIIINFVFGFWATKSGLRKTIRHVGENCLLRIQRNIWSYFRRRLSKMQFMPPKNFFLKRW